MLCEKCKIKKASVFYTELDRTRHSLCSMCVATMKGGVRDYIEISDCDEKTYFPSSYLYELVHAENTMYYCKEDVEAANFCGECKISVGDVLKRGYLNCPECYVSFSNCPQTICYGDVNYQRESSQIPRKYSQRLLREQRISSLRDSLREAVRVENYELAAQIRDEIKRISL